MELLSISIFVITPPQLMCYAHFSCTDATEQLYSHCYKTLLIAMILLNSLHRPYHRLTALTDLYIHATIYTEVQSLQLLKLWVHVYDIVQRSGINEKWGDIQPPCFLRPCLVLVYAKTGVFTSVAKSIHWKEHYGGNELCRNYSNHKLLWKKRGLSKGYGKTNYFKEIRIKVCIS